MDDRTRRDRLMERLADLPGLDEGTFERLSRELQARQAAHGDDSRGRLKVAMFDARQYDRASFELANADRFDIHYLPFPLTVNTVAAAAGFRAVCLFVNDTCNRDVVDALAVQGVEIVALRCAGFNNVDLTACERRGISVVRVPAYSPHAVAEHTVALMLMLNRHLHTAYQRN